MDTRERLFLATNKKGNELNDFLQDNDPIQVFRKYDWAERRADKINGYVITFILPDEVFAQDGNNAFSAWLSLSIIADPRCEMSPDSRGWLRHNYVKSLEDDDSIEDPFFESTYTPSRMKNKEIQPIENSTNFVITKTKKYKVDKSKNKNKPLQIRLDDNDILSLQILKERFAMSGSEIIRSLIQTLFDSTNKEKNKDLEYYTIKFEPKPKNL